MTRLVPLCVRLSNARTSLDVTNEVRDVEVRDTDPGGFASVRLRLDRRLAAQPRELAYYTKVIVTDGRNGTRVGEGRLEDLGRSVGPDGQTWDVTALGPAGYVRDEVLPIIYLDRDLTGWRQADNVYPNAQVSQGVDPGDTNGVRAALVHTWPNGSTVTTSHRAVHRYGRLHSNQANQKLGRLDVTWDAGRSDANWQAQIYTRIDGGLGTGGVSQASNFNTAGGTFSRLIVSHFTSGHNSVDLRSAPVANLTTAADDYWASFYSPVVQATRFNKAGTELLTALDYPGTTILASQVVEDLLGRGTMLASFDGVNARVDTTAFAIEHLAYVDPVDPGQVFDDMMRLEPAYSWYAWESNAAGKHRFEWRVRPTVVRYEADPVAYTAPASADGLYSKMLIRYLDINGETVTIRRSTPDGSPILEAAGLERAAFVDLGSEVGGNSNANQYADRFLADHVRPPNAGSVDVAGPVLDTVAGRLVAPWEVRAGQLIRIRGIQPRVDSLNATSRDGVSVFRIVDKTFTASTGVARLELDSYPPTVARALAALRRATTPGARPGRLPWTR